MKKVIYTEKAPKPIGPYSQAYKVDNVLYCSGQVPLNPTTGEISGTNVAEQTEMTVANINAVLTAAGLGFEDVVKTTCYLTTMADFAAFNAVYEKYFVSKPARSCVAVKELPKGSLVEIEVLAIKD